MTEVVEVLRDLIRFDTTNPPGNEGECIAYVQRLLTEAGVDSKLVARHDARPNLIARLPGAGEAPPLLLYGHVDVVTTAGQRWTHPPFAADTAVNTMWGRGTLDMKGIAICQLLAFLTVAREHPLPERDVVFLATADEEEGGTMGVAWLLAHRPDVFEGIRYTFNEGGINESFSERLMYFGVEIGSKMIVRADVRAPSRAAMQQVRIALEPYFSPRDPDRVLPEVRAFLHDLAPRRIEQRELLEDVDRTIAEGKFWLLTKPYQEVAQNIVFTEAIDGDARGATMRVLLFNLPDEDPDRRLAWLAELIRPYGATIAKVVQKSGPAPLSPRNTPMFARIAAEVHRQWGNDVTVGTEVLAVAINDSWYLRARGIVCYGFWPFQVDFYQTQGIHSVNERVRLDWFQEGVEVMRRLVVRYATER